MSIYLCEVTRLQSEEKITRSAWAGHGLQKMVPSGTRILPPEMESRIYVVVCFDVRLGEDALHEQLDRELRGQFGLPMDTDLTRYAKDPHTAGQITYPPMWKPTSPTDDPLHSADDVSLTATRDQPFALCWIPTCHNLKTVRERFHNQVRPENLRPKVEAFQREWSHEKVTVPKWTAELEAGNGNGLPKPGYENKEVQIYPYPEDLPHDFTVRRTGEIKWEAICAFDFPVKKLNCPVTEFLFDRYRLDSGRKVLSNKEKDELLKSWRNGRVAVAKTVREMDAKMPPVAETLLEIWDDLFRHVPPES